MKHNYSIRDLFWIIPLTLATIFIIVYVNVLSPSSIIKVGQKCNTLTLDLFDGTKFDVKNDDNCSFVYFISDFNKDEINALDQQANDLYQMSNEYNGMLNIFVVINASKDIYESEVLAMETENIIYAYDEDKKNISKFSTDADIHYLLLDKNDRVVTSESSLLNIDYFQTTVLITLSGKVVGNKVGEYCYNRSIDLYNTSDKFSVASNRGKILIINFWSKDCGPCIQELPHFNEIGEKYADDVIVVAIHEASVLVGYEDYVLNQLINKRFKNYTNIKFGYDRGTADIKSIYYEELGGTGTLPYTIIVDQDGVVAKVKTDAATYENLEQEVLKLKNLNVK